MTLSEILRNTAKTVYEAPEAHLHISQKVELLNSISEHLLEIHKCEQYDKYKEQDCGR